MGLVSEEQGGLANDLDDDGTKKRGQGKASAFHHRDRLIERHQLAKAEMKISAINPRATGSQYSSPPDE